MGDCRPPGSNTVKVPVAWYAAQEKESKKWVRAPLIALKPFQDRVVDLCQSQEFDEPVHVVSDHMHIIGDGNLNLNLKLSPLKVLATPYAGVWDPDRATRDFLWLGFGLGLICHGCSATRVGRPWRSREARRMPCMCVAFIYLFYPSPPHWKLLSW